LCCKKCVRANEFEQTKPDHFNNSFAGVDKDAVDAAREQMFPFPPRHHQVWRCSKRRIVHMLERHHIEADQLK
jgi:putative YphP/YqiW family bacilliredoxin